MSKKLITCPVCGNNERVIKNAIVNHDFSIVRCTGSKMNILEIVKKNK